MNLPEPLQTISSFVPFLTLGITIVLAWYVNSVLKHRFQREEFIERQLKELYRPMDILLKANRDAFKQYSKAESDEKKMIAQLWYLYFGRMKELILKNSHLLIETTTPSVVTQLLLHIDAYNFDYERYANQKIEDPFPSRRGIPFPTDANEYFAQSCVSLLEKLPRGKPGVLRRAATALFVALGLQYAVQVFRALLSTLFANERRSGSDS